MSNFIRQSKFRHLFGTPFQNTECINQVKLGSVQVDSQVLKVNAQYFAVPWSGQGNIAVIPLGSKGAVNIDTPLLEHEENSVNDFSWDPFDRNVLATACQDGSLALWQIPEGGLTQSLTNPTKSIKVSDKRLLNVDFHPLAENVVVVADAGKEVKLYDVDSGSERLALPNVHKGLLTNWTWNAQGSLVATSCKDKNLRIFDPRANQCVAEVLDHQGVKGSRNLWLRNKDYIFTCGFALKGSERNLALYDPRKIDTPLTKQDIDVSSSTLFPFCDHDNNVLFLGGKGDGNIRFYEVVDDDKFVHYLNEFKSKDPQSGLDAGRKHLVDVRKCELLRLYKITPQGVLVPIKFEVPRLDNGFFQEDLFPDTWDGTPSMSSDEWFGGANNQPRLKNMDPNK